MVMKKRGRGTRMRRWFGKSLKRKLSLLLLVAIVLPLLLTGMVSYQIASAITADKAKQSGMNTLRQIAGKLEFIAQDVENMSIFLIGQRDIQAYLDSEQDDAVRYTMNVGFLTNLAFSKKIYIQHQYYACQREATFEHDDCASLRSARRAEAA